MRGQASGTVDDVVVGAGEVAAVGVLHLDHARAEIGENAGTHRGGDSLLHRDHGHTGQRGALMGRHITMPPSTGSTCPVM